MKVGLGMHQEGLEGVSWAWECVGGGGNMSVVAEVFDKYKCFPQDCE